jgi:hypothetical protein
LNVEKYTFQSLTSNFPKEECSMNAKDTAKQMIDTLPNTVTMDEVIHALCVTTRFDLVEREIRDGKGISDEDARLRLVSIPKKTKTLVSSELNITQKN